MLNFTVVDFVYTNLKTQFLTLFIFLYGLEMLGFITPHSLLP